MYGLKYIPLTSFVNTTFNRCSNKIILNNYNMYVSKENIYIDFNMNYLPRYLENYLIMENIKINMKDKDVKINYYHRILYNDSVISTVKYFDPIILDNCKKTTLWSCYNNSIKKLYYDINKDT
jgi:hypothetical protein